MAYYGAGGPGPTPMYPGATTQGPRQGNPYFGSHATNSQFGNQAPTAPPQYSEMYQQQQQFEYNGNNMPPPQWAQQQQEYYGHPQQNQEQYGPSQGSTQNSTTGSNIMATGRSEPTKILRNPFPAVSKEMVRKGADVYDPGFPTSQNGPLGGQSQFAHQRVAPPPPLISNMSSGGMHPPVSMSAGPPVPPQAPIYSSGPGMQSDGRAGMYNNGMYENNFPPHSQPQQPPAGPPANYQSYPTNPAAQYQSNNNDNSHSQQIQQESVKPKLHVMTGVVTQVQPGAFGMVSEEIFFQENVVSGPLPKVGDKVVVEAEAVNGMPFKFNAKRVTRLDIDLVHEEKTAPPPPPPILQQQQQQHHPQQYQNHQPPSQQQYPGQTHPQQYPQQNVQPLQHYQSNMPSIDNRLGMADAPNYGPLPSLPDSLNLPKPVPPPNLAAVLPRSSSSSEPPLKSILKRRGSPSLKRNPPPPPVISKTAGNDNANLYKSTAPSTLKKGALTMDMDRDVAKILPSRGNGPPIEFPEYTFFNKERPKPAPRNPSPGSPRVTRLLPRSPVTEFNSEGPSSWDDLRDQHRGQRSHEREHSSTRRQRSRSRSKSPKGNFIRRSRSPSPRRYRRSRSRSVSPMPRRRSVSPQKSRRNRSRSVSPYRHSRRYSRSPSPRSRRRSRSPSQRNRRRSSRSSSRGRTVDSRSRRNYRTRHSSRSLSRSPNRRRSRSPQSSTGLKVLGETVTCGIVVKRVSSDLFPKLGKRDRDSPDKDVEIIRRDGKYNIGQVSKPSAPAPVPVKFQIAKATPVVPSSIVPNPSFKAPPPTLVQNPVYSLTKTVTNPLADAKNKRKKAKEQEPAFRIVDNQTEKNYAASNTNSTEDKIKQWEAERQSLKANAGEKPPVEKLLRNPVSIMHLKQTIQNELQELRAKSQSDVGKKLLQNPIDIEKLKQTVQKDLQDLKSKESVSSTKAKVNDPAEKATTPVINKTFDKDVQQRLQDLRSKFETHLKDAKAAVASKKASVGGPPKPKPATITSKSIPEKQTVTLVSDYLQDAPPVGVPRFPRKQPSETSDRSRGPPPNRRNSPPPMELPPYDEQMERLQEEIHQQRFMEEEQRLKSLGDRAGLEQLYYMEDRRRRRMEERHLARIRIMEIQLKKEKKFGDLAKLREEWGPAAQRLEQERELRHIRINEEQHENQLHGQAEAIRRQELEYQKWLEDEAAARSRNVPPSNRDSRGCEGRVLRRRTPSPSSHRRNEPPPDFRGPPESYESYHRGAPPDTRGPPPEPRGSHPLRRRSRSPSYERYQEDWHRRHPRDRSPPMDYEQFVMRYPMMHPGDNYPPNHPDFDGPRPPPLMEQEQDGFFISRLDDVARRQNELMHREREIQERLEMAQRRIGGPPPPTHSHYRGGRDDDRDDFRRFVLPRR